MKKRFRQRRFHNFIRKFFIVVPLAVKNTLVFTVGCLEVVENVRFLRMQSISFVNLLIAGVHINIGKNWVQNVIYLTNERKWILFLHRVFLIRFYLLLVLLFYFFAIVSFITTAPDKFQFQSEVRLSQINVIVPIPLKFKLYAVFIKWGNRIGFLFMRRQDIVN